MPLPSAVRRGESPPSFSLQLTSRSLPTSICFSFSNLYRAIAGIGTHSPISPTAMQQQQQQPTTKSARRRTGAAVGIAQIGSPTNFQHVLDHPVNPFASPTQRPEMRQVGQYAADPFADPQMYTERATVRQVYGQGVQRKGVRPQDISGPVRASASHIAQVTSTDWSRFPPSDRHFANQASAYDPHTPTYLFSRFPSLPVSLICDAAPCGSPFAPSLGTLLLISLAS